MPSSDADVAFLAHNDGDDVAVAVRPVQPGPASVAYLDSTPRIDIEVTEAIPYGHKVAISDMAAEATVTEYGLPVGIARTDIARGAYVHTHNLRSARWQKSI